MNFWLILVAYEAVWFAAVIGAGHDLAWPGVVAAVVFAAWRLAVSAHWRIELRLIGAGLLLGVVAEAAWGYGGLIRYEAARPWTEVPAWILALWMAFALTIVPLFGYLRERPWLAALFGAIGGPLAYFAAARGWHAATFVAPVWRVLPWLALGWGISLSLLCVLARRWLRATDSIAPAPQRSAS